MQRWRSGLTLLFAAFFLGGGCRFPSRGPVIVLCSPDSPRMHQARRGLEAALGLGTLEVACVPEFGGQGQETLRRLQKRHPRLLVTLGTPALCWVAPEEKRTPVVFALVANPFFTGAAYEPDHPEIHQENITGIFSPPPLRAALQQGAGLLGGGVWGLLYDPNDGVAVDLKERFRKEAPLFGIEPVTAAGVDAASDGRGLKNLLTQGARVIYLPPAPSAGRYADILMNWGRDLKVMVVSGHPEAPHQGAVLWVALDYGRLGEEAGALARRVLAGEAPASLPIREKTPLQVEVDETLLRRWSSYPSGQKRTGGKKDKTSSSHTMPRQPLTCQEDFNDLSPAI
jgi:ABC-type uncharacterized transport system substrate-binding protein